MNKYKEFELAIFNWLKSKNYADQDFTFSVRQKANKGAELNYFIGTENSKYFSTTFWNIPVAYPGSSSDLINLVFGFDKSNNYVYDIQFNQTKNPESEQNELALQLIRNCKTTIKSTFDRFYENDASNKMEFFRINGKSSYTSIDELIIDANADIEKVIPIVSAEIDKLKQDHPSFKGHRFTIQEQKKMFEKMEVRFKNYQNSGTQIVLIDDTEDELVSESQVKSDIPLNQILYGPPGTGKTYNSINKAISIINPEFDLTQDRSLIKKEYDRLVTENQILFTTFHQSMSYEDFIEGIKPETKEENVIYDVVPGLFLEICNTAENNWEDAKEGNSQKLSFEDAFLLLKEEWVENEEIKFPLKREGNDFTILGFTKKSIQFKKASGGTGHTLSIGTLKDYYYKKKEVRLTGVGIYYPSILDKLNKYQPTTISQKVIKNYVIIIDEINRGNVSQIFGELITLIEEDKRLGKDEALEVMLPYSKEKFGVPPNLYIVGTMNTADRSVEALDTALRRRFSFEEIQPNPSLIATEGKLKETQGIVDDINLPRVLETINNRIEILSNRDHKIGHSYFMKVTSLVDLKATFKKNIIPLLQEYFYNDYEKIGWVVGEGFFVQQKIDKKTIFTKFFKEPKPEFEVAYQLADIDTIDIKKAMLQLLGDFKEEPQTENIEN